MEASEPLKEEVAEVAVEEVEVAEVAEVAGEPLAVQAVAVAVAEAEAEAEALAVAEAEVEPATKGGRYHIRRTCKIGIIVKT